MAMNQMLLERARAREPDDATRAQRAPEGFTQLEAASKGAHARPARVAHRNRARRRRRTGQDVSRSSPSVHRPESVECSGARADTGQAASPPPRPSSAAWTMRPAETWQLMRGDQQVMAMPRVAFLRGDHAQPLVPPSRSADGLPARAGRPDPLDLWTKCGRESIRVGQQGRSAVMLEVLHGSFVPLSRSTGLEGAEVAASAGLGIALARIQPISAGRQLPYHDVPPGSS